MNEPNPLLCCRIAAGVDAIAADPAAADAKWASLARDYARTEQKDDAVEAAISSRDLDAVRKILTEWDGDHRPRPAEDRALLKKAMKAFRKRLKLARLDDESKLGHDAMTKGERSRICAVKPPEQYPVEVWDALVESGRLVKLGQGLYEIVEQ